MTCGYPAKCWLGRQDSNLRMPVPKTAPPSCNRTAFLRLHRLAHRLESMTYQQIAERFRPARRQSDATPTTNAVRRA
jgi:hypothetical protein